MIEYKIDDKGFEVYKTENDKSSVIGYMEWFGDLPYRFWKTDSTVTTEDVQNAHYEAAKYILNKIGNGKKCTSDSVITLTIK